MKIKDRIDIAFRNLLRRKSRTILTILSVLIGTVSIIMMISLSLAMAKQQRDMVESFGGLENIEISSDKAQTSINQSSIGKFKKIKHVKYVIPHKDLYTEIFLKKNKDTKLEANNGISLIPDKVFAQIKSDMLDSGSNLNPSDDLFMILGSDYHLYKMKKQGESFEQEDVEGLNILKEKFILRLGYEDMENNPTDEEGNTKPTFADLEIKVKGIMNESSFLEKSRMYINEKTYKTLQKEDKKLQSPSLEDMSENGGKKSNYLYENITLVCDKYENVKAVEDEVKSMGYQTSSSIDMIEEINKSTRTIMLILAGIGSIAFIVAAIGIINTMLMSIYERQKEIGLMKVIGASVSDIKTMFLLESGFIGFFGGLVGLLISYLLGFIANKFLLAGFAQAMDTALEFNIPIWLGVMAVIFSSFIGILAGYLPAIRATKLSAIETLRSN